MANGQSKGIKMGIGIPFFDLPDLNPIHAAFGWIKDQLSALVNGTVDSVERLILTPHGTGNSAWEQYLFGNGIGLAESIAIAVTFVTCMIAMFWQKRIVNFGQALGASLIISVVAPTWIASTDYLISTGQEVSAVFRFKNLQGGNEKLLNVPDVVNTLGSIIGLSIIFILAFILLLVFAFYFVADVFVKFFGLIAIAVYPIGKRSQRFANTIFSIGLVAMLLGPQFALLSINLGRFVANSAGGGKDPLILTVFLGAGMVLAIVMQYVLYVAANQVVNTVSGRIGASVRGDVDASVRQQQPIDTRSINEANFRSMRAPVSADLSESSSTASSSSLQINEQTGSTDASEKSGVNSSPGVSSAVVVASNVNPAAKVAITTANAINSRRQQNSSPSKENPSDG